MGCWLFVPFSTFPEFGRDDPTPSKLLWKPQLSADGNLLRPLQQAPSRSVLTICGLAVVGCPGPCCGSAASTFCRSPTATKSSAMWRGWSKPLPRWGISHTWTFRCRGIPTRRSGSRGDLGVLCVLRCFALFCGRLPLLCGRFAAICGRFLFLGVCGTLRAFASKTGSMPIITRNSLTFESPGSQKSSQYMKRLDVSVCVSCVCCVVFAFVTVFCRGVFAWVST